MNFGRLPALALAISLQVLPVCRVALVNQAAPSGSAIILRWATAVAALGTFHAVSGASSAVAGVAPVNAQGQFTGPVTSTASGTVGQVFRYEIVVTNPGINPQQAYYRAAPLPPGLTINTNLGGNGEITGTPTAGGVYGVTVTAGNANYVGVVTKAITITIQGSGSSPPTITTQPQSLTVTNGGPAAFAVVAAGTAPLSYQWLKDGLAITGATNSAYDLTLVTTNQAGGYLVKVANSAGSVTSATATLTVLVPAWIITQPQSLTVAAGATAAFTVVAGGSSPLTYQWRFFGTDLTGATTASLVVSNAQPANTGDFTVLVGNLAGAVTSGVAHLTVQAGPPVPLSLASPVWAQGGFSFAVSSPAGTNFVVWRSADLKTWAPLLTNSTAGGGVFPFMDSSPEAGRAFYRATLSP